MKITESQLRQLVDEEIALMVENGEIDEGWLDRLRAKASGLGGRARAGASRLAGKAAGAAERAASVVDMGAQDDEQAGTSGRRQTVGDVAAGSAAAAEKGAQRREKAAAAKELAKIKQISGRKLMKARKALYSVYKDIKDNIAGFESDDATNAMVDELFDLTDKVGNLGQKLSGD